MVFNRRVVLVTLEFMSGDSSWVRFNEHFDLIIYCLLDFRILKANSSREWGVLKVMSLEVTHLGSNYTGSYGGCLSSNFVNGRFGLNWRAGIEGWIIIEYAIWE